MEGSILCAMSMTTDVVFWNEHAKYRLGWKVSTAHRMTSSALRSSSRSLTSRGSIGLPLIRGGASTARSPLRRSVAEPRGLLLVEG